MNGGQDGSPSPNLGACHDTTGQFDSTIDPMNTTTLQYNDIFNPNPGVDLSTDQTPYRKDYAQTNMSEQWPNMASNQAQFITGLKQENIPNYLLQNPLDQNTFESDLVDYNQYNSEGASQGMIDDTVYNNTPSHYQSINPSELMSDTSSPFSHTTSPSNVFTSDNIHQPLQIPQQSSPFIPNAFSPSPRHSRNVSLGPESAHFPNAQLPADWSMMPPSRFTNHRRSPSEFSEFSSTSVVPSPNLLHLDSFDSTDYHSPLCPPQDTSAYPDGLELNNFSLNDDSLFPGLSPSPLPSPYLNTQMAPTMTPQQQFLLALGFTPESQIFNTPMENNMPGQFQRPSIQSNSSLEMAQTSQMVPPEINVEFAPASRQNSFEPPKPALDEDSLTPPARGRNRRRAASDVTGAARPPTPTSGSGAHLGVSQPTARSLSTNTRLAIPPSRVNRRQSTSVLPNRDYILGLADPEHTPATGADSGSARRAQRHPATFQCTLCPKKFTRAYNLRSHLRTHTDERPFICTVCGKAFARQHDRKRHEGLHSGEKKFVCKGDLQQGGSWGCGRRFARADALGRHFRSEAGRVCIKPLLDEEAQERSRQWQEQQLHNLTQNMQQPQMMRYDANGFPMDANGNYTLPAALLAQYPALATINWPDLNHSGQDMDDDISGRSSFDASASDYYDENGDDDYLSSGNGQSSTFGQSGSSQQFNTGYKSDY